MFTLGIDLGSSSVKVSLLDLENGRVKASAYEPPDEMNIISKLPGWAEQDPGEWWKHMKSAIARVLSMAGINKKEIVSLGISYQMHGLVIVDRDLKPIRDSIIWCDSRATDIGEKAYTELGEKYCNESLLNSPGNFTASKLKWVQENEPESYGRIYKIMLPGDYIAMRMTGRLSTTASGLSEGILWDMKQDRLADRLMEYYSIDPALIPDLVPAFGEQGRLTPEASAELGLMVDTPVSYRAGDQPNNAFSLNVLEPGDIAATAGTSGVLYGVSREASCDPLSRVNTFLHVNHTVTEKRYGVLFCLNGAGIMYKWLRKLGNGEITDYESMNNRAAMVEPGCRGLKVFPFGNGSERMLLNLDHGCSISGLNFNIHKPDDLYRASLEGIVYSMNCGIGILKESGIEPNIIKAGSSNLFLSRPFLEILASLSGVAIRLYNTDGALGAARGAAIGAEYYRSSEEAFKNLEIIGEVQPEKHLQSVYRILYDEWLDQLEKNIKNH